MLEYYYWADSKKGLVVAFLPLKEGISSDYIMKCKPTLGIGEKRIIM